MTVEWNRTVTEVVWESQTAPGITWTTVVGGTSSGGGVTVHNDLSGRSAADAHPMSAITDLEPALTDIATAVQAQQGDIGTLQTAVAGKQAADADLTAIAALAPADDALIQRKAGAWTSRTPAQVKADMSIGVGDVSGLDENTRDVIGTALVAGSGVAVTVDDPGNTITIAVSGVVADAINDGTTTVAPSQNAVFDALAAKAPIASPTFTGTPAAPTPAQGTNTTQLATTAYVQIEAGLLVPKSTVTTKGDLIVGTGSGAVTRRGIGSNGQVLTADSAQADGLRWARLAENVRVVGSSRITVGSNPCTLLVPLSGGNVNRSIANGTMYLCNTGGSGQTISALNLQVVSTSLTSGQAVTVAVYEDLADGAPGLRLWTQTVTIGTTTGTISATGLSLVVPTGPYWIGILNPNGNAGAVTLLGAPPLPVPRVGLFTASAPNPVVGLGAALTATPSDLTSFTFASAVGATQMQVNPIGAAIFPLIGAVV